MSFIGSLLKGATTPGFEFGHYIVDQSGEEVGPHGHLDAHIIWAVSGCFTTEAEGETPNDSNVVVFNPQETYHADRFEAGPASFFALNIDAWICAEMEHNALPSAPTKIGTRSVRALLHRLVTECANWGPDSPLVAESLCFDILNTISTPCNPERSPPGWLNRAIDMLNEPDRISIAEVAIEAGVHPTHLIRGFRDHVNCTPGEFRRAARLEAAARHVCGSRETLAEIAGSCGYADQSHFTRHFKRAYGVTPAIYREETTRAAARKQC